MVSTYLISPMVYHVQVSFAGFPAIALYIASNFAKVGIMKELSASTQEG